MLSVIVPAFNEEPSIDFAAGRIGDVLRKARIRYEIIFVDDGSKDSTWERICALSAADRAVRGVSFSRNFGKDAAIMAGLEAAAGECCAVIDCDLQHPPEKLPEMYSLWQQGFEIINGEKRSRGKESALHRTAAGLFNLIMNKALKTDMTRSSDFKLIDRRVARALLEMPERRVFFRALSAWVGYRATSVEFDVVERKNGSSNWSALGLAKYALANVTSFSSAPMQIVTVLGLVTLVFSLVIGIQTLVKWFGGSAVPGFTTVIIRLGIIGYYIAQIYAQIKGRPRYIVARRCGGGEFDE